MFVWYIYIILDIQYTAPKKISTVFANIFWSKGTKCIVYIYVHICIYIYIHMCIYMYLGRSSAKRIVMSFWCVFWATSLHEAASYIMFSVPSKPYIFNYGKTRAKCFELSGFLKGLHWCLKWRPRFGFNAVIVKTNIDAVNLPFFQ